MVWYLGWYEWRFQVKQLVYLDASLRMRQAVCAFHAGDTRQGRHNPGGEDDGTGGCSQISVACLMTRSTIRSAIAHQARDSRSRANHRVPLLRNVGRAYPTDDFVDEFGLLLDDLAELSDRLALFVQAHLVIRDHLHRSFAVPSRTAARL